MSAWHFVTGDSGGASYMNRKGRVIQVRFPFPFENSFDDVAVKSHGQCVTYYRVKLKTDLREVEKYELFLISVKSLIGWYHKLGIEGHLQGKKYIHFGCRLQRLPFKSFQ